MSRTAVIVPRTVPVTFDRPRRGVYATSPADDRPARLPGAHDRLDRVAAAPVGDRQLEQGGAPRDPQRSHVAQCEAGVPAHAPGQLEVRHARMHRPGPPARRHAAPDHQVGAGPQHVDELQRHGRVE